MTTNTEIDELAKAALAAAKPANENPGDGWKAKVASEAWSRFQSAATPEAWLSLSSRVENARREAIEDVITIMLNATFTKTHAETLEAIRNLIPGDKP